ncbi:CCA tRNA nucleotidyltransferase [Mesoterricola silvestris]|uniref:HDIG domain-containing protein n=1 Tax=Mesoterricola silvestris TaxID=2927979 RepID=A0AA48H0A3_9BACT|nr:HD domain-containing protein [Mesoterricola silvestris]BDU73663.1 HDIG domain-containing protein [Mesoterricola silvestris]
MKRPTTFPTSMREFLRTLHQALGPDSGLVLVGGAVRDLLLDRPSPDWDLATALLPGEVMDRARAAGLRVIPTGLQHGTVTVMVGAKGFEVTTFRGDEAYVDGRRPESVRLGVALEEDLARRDFTINAMALPAQALDGGPWEPFLVDPFGGRGDLASGTLRAVGDPLERFGEDGLRCLRACRFASQLDFDIEPGTLAAIPRRLEVAGKVSVERVLAELTKLLCGLQPGKGLSALATSGLLGLWLAELQPMIGCLQNRYHAYPVWEHTLEVVRRTPPDPGLRWAALLHDCGKPARRSEDAQGHIHFYGHEPVSVRIAGEILARLRASGALARDVIALVAHHGTHPGPEWGDPACRRFLRRLREDGLSLERWGAFRLADQSGKGMGDGTCLGEHREVMARLEALARSNPPLDVKALALDGRALMALANRKGGPWLGELQGHLLERVLDEPGLNAPGPLAELARAFLTPGAASP